MKNDIWYLTDLNKKDERWNEKYYKLDFKDALIWTHYWSSTKDTYSENWGRKTGQMEDDWKRKMSSVTKDYQVLRVVYLVLVVAIDP